MKKIYISLFGFLALAFGASGQTTINIMDSVVFFDGYASVVSDPTPVDVIRLRNDLMTKKITDAQLASIGDQLTINIVISALCDNYDRIGNVNLALVPKGSTTYNTATVGKIEIGRFITPFMNKNVNPKSVPYTFVVPNVAKILKSSEIYANYDFWLELEVFGVPYAANTQISGCSGRSDVFQGKVDFVTNGSPSYDPQTVLTPISFKADFNNYGAGASDAIGTTVKTLSFDVDQTLYDATLYLITSNHGANNGGEEYVRRLHHVSVDGIEVLTYLPNGKSCEPYRQYNTQGNGIYGSSAHTESWWTDWNNWCPGDTISTREISLGTIAPGTHSFVISVPDAQFVDGQGNFPLSLYFQGSKTDGLGIGTLNKENVRIYPNPAKNVVNIDSEFEIEKLELLNPSGQQIAVSTNNQFYINSFESGMYFIRVTFKDGSSIIQQFVKN